MAQQEGYKSDMESYRAQLAHYAIRLGTMNEIDESLTRVNYSYWNNIKGSLIILKGENLNESLLKAVKRDEKIRARTACTK